MKMFKKVLVAVLAAVMVLSMALPVSAANASYFSDVDPNAWYAEAVYRWKDEGVLEGDAGTKLFRPEDNIKRSELTKLVVRILDVKGTEGFENPFSDVVEADWFYEVVLAAAEKGLVNGYPDGTFKPANSITREEAIAVLCRATMGAHADADCLAAFDDVDEIGSWAVGYVDAFVGEGIVIGDDQDQDGVMEIRPKDFITRAEVAVLLDRLFPEDVTMKIYGKVTAGDVTAEAKVFSDFSGEFALTEGELSVTEISAELELMNIASAGIDHVKRSKTVKFDNDFTFDTSMLTIYDFESGVVEVNVDGVEVVYDVTGEYDGNGIVIKAVPNSTALVREAIAAAREHVTYKELGSAENHVNLEAGSYAVFNTKRVDCSGLLIDGVGADFAEIQNKVTDALTITSVAINPDHQLEIKVAAGSCIAVQGYEFILDDDMTVTVSAAALDAELYADLVTALKTGTKEEVAIAAFTMINNMFDACNGDTVEINVSFN